MNVTRLQPEKDSPVDINKEFEGIFWPEWPNKKAKRYAFRCFCSARKRASLAEIMQGVRTYKEHKEEYRAWMHASTFLNGDCWADEYDTPEADPWKAWKAKHDE